MGRRCVEQEVGQIGRRENVIAKEPKEAKEYLMWKGRGTPVFQARQWDEEEEPRKADRQGNWKQTWSHYVKRNGQNMCVITDMFFAETMEENVERREDEKNAGRSQRQGGVDNAKEKVKEVEERCKQASVKRCQQRSRQQ